MWAIALMFWWGGWLLHRFSGNNDKDGIVFTFRDFLIAMFSIFFSLSGLSTAFEGAVDRTKAHAAAAHIFELTDRTSLIDPLSEQGKTNV